MASKTIKTLKNLADSNVGLPASKIGGDAYRKFPPASLTNEGVGFFLPMDAGSGAIEEVISDQTVALGSGMTWNGKQLQTNISTAAGLNFGTAESAPLLYATYPKFVLLRGGFFNDASEFGTFQLVSDTGTELIGLTVAAGTLVKSFVIISTGGLNSNYSKVISFPLNEQLDILAVIEPVANLTPTELYLSVWINNVLVIDKEALNRKVSEISNQHLKIAGYTGFNGAGAGYIACEGAAVLQPDFIDYSTNRQAWIDAAKRTLSAWSEGRRVIDPKFWGY